MSWSRYYFLCLRYICYCHFVCCIYGPLYIIMFVLIILSSILSSILGRSVQEVCSNKKLCTNAMRNVLQWFELDTLRFFYYFPITGLQVVLLYNCLISAVNKRFDLLLKFAISFITKYLCYLILLVLQFMHIWMFLSDISVAISRR